jgi:serine/threonine protein kinase
MPFDDSDIKKMIEAQITKGGLRLGSEGSSEVQDLILRMLQPEVTQRWPIELVQKHPWFGKPINAENQASSLSYVTTTTVNRGQEQNGVHQIQKRQGQAVYA